MKKSKILELIKNDPMSASDLLCTEEAYVHLDREYAKLKKGSVPENCGLWSKEQCIKFENFYREVLTDMLKQGFEFKTFEEKYPELNKK